MTSKNSYFLHHYAFHTAYKGVTDAVKIEKSREKFPELSFKNTLMQLTEIFMNAIVIADVVNASTYHSTELLHW